MQTPIIYHQTLNYECTVIIQITPLIEWRFKKLHSLDAIILSSFYLLQGEFLLSER